MVRVVQCSVVVTVLVMLVSTTAAGRTAGPSTPVPVRRIPPSIPTLRGPVVALATLVALDPKAQVAEFRTGCGWYTKLVGKEQYVRPRQRLPAGLWKVSLQRIEFDLDSDPGEADGYTQTVTRATWERYVVQYGWSGYLTLGKYGSLISDAGHTDVCHGVLG